MALGRYKEALHVGDERVKLCRRAAATNSTRNQLLACEEAVKLHRSLQDSESETGTLTVILLANSLKSMGFFLRTLGRHKESLSRAQEAVDLQRRLIATDPDCSGFLVRSPKKLIMGSFAHALENLAFSLSAVGKADDAAHAAGESVDIYRSLPDRTGEWEAAFACALSSLAAFLRKVDRQEDALRPDREGADIYHNLAKTDAELTARSFHGAAQDLRSIGLHEDALRAEGQSAHLYRTITQTRPALLGLRIRSLQSLAEDLRVLGRAEDAARTDAELADVGAMRGLEQIPKNWMAWLGAINRDESEAVH